MTPPDNLVLSHCLDSDALGLFARDLHNGCRAVPCVVGPSAISVASAERWQAVADQPYHRTGTMRVYRLEAVNPVKEVSGYCRRADEYRLGS